MSSGQEFDHLLSELEAKAVSLAGEGHHSQDEIKVATEMVRAAAYEMLLDLNFRICVVAIFLTIAVPVSIFHYISTDRIPGMILALVAVLLFVLLWAGGRLVIRLDVVRGWRKDWALK